MRTEGASVEVRPGSVSNGPKCAAPRVLLTSTNRWPSAARIAIGLARLGCRISAICPPRGHPIHVTSVVQHVFPYSSVWPIDSLLRAIEVSNPDILIPCDDQSVEHLHELHVRARVVGSMGAHLADLIEYSLGSPSSYPIVSRRWELLHVAQEEGIRVPDFQRVETPQDLKSWGDGHQLPWVLKGDGTFGGRGVRIVPTPEVAEPCFWDLTRLFRATRAIKRAIVNRDPFWLRPWWQNQRPSVIVQSYIQGRPANCTFACSDGEVQAMIGVEVLSSDGLTGPASLVRVVKNPDMMLAARRLARRLNLSGFFGLDFMIEENSGETFLIEMNPRCTPLSHLQLGEGRDLMTALTSKLLGQPLMAPPPVTENDLIAYFPPAAESKNDLVRSSFEDIPLDEPALVEALRRPWPDSGFLYRLVSKLSGPTPLAKDRESLKSEITSL